MKKTKKIISLIITALLLLSLSVNIYANDDISVYIDNEKIEFDVPPRLIGGRTMVPLRAIFEGLGATVNWDESTRTVTAYNITTVVKATIDVDVMSVNYIDKVMDVAPMIINDRTFVPARFIAEAFGCDVDWNGSTKTVYITSKPIDYNDLEKDDSSSPNTSNSNIYNTNDEEKYEEKTTATSSSYYPGTSIPTYTSVTGVRCFDTTSLSNGAPVYMYKYTSASDVGDYWRSLSSHGWRLLEGDKTSTTNTFESSYHKGSKFVIINVYLDTDQVWITYN